MVHGTKVEGLYSILADVEQPGGGLKASVDKDAGQRYNKDKAGVYFYELDNAYKCQSYSRWTPLTNDGVMYRVFLHCDCDRSYRKPYK